MAQPGLGRRMRQVLLGTVPNAFAALSAGDPGDACAFLVEPTIGTNGYARQAITWSAVSAPISGAPAVLTNSNALVFTPTGSWNSNIAISHVAVFTASTGTAEAGFIGTCGLDPARLIDRAGTVLTIPIGALQLTIGLED